MPLEALRYDITPAGLHYLLIHFDIPFVDSAAYELKVDGSVHRPLRLKLSDIRARPRKTLAVTMECAGNGRARLSPRPMSQPWLTEAVGTAEWTGTPLSALLEEADAMEGARTVVFGGLDRGVQGGVEQVYERSLSWQDATQPDVLLAYEMNGRPLLPQHGFPLRLIVPGWYGLAHVKWLDSITVSNDEFRGYQQAVAYHFRVDAADPGRPVSRILPRALMVPPGIPDFMSRTRFAEPGRHAIEGRAWSGHARIAGVDFSADGGKTWVKTQLETSPSAYAWSRWSHEWDAGRPGRYELCVRAIDVAGNMQPAEQSWNPEGVMNNAVQRVHVVVGEELPKQPPMGSL